MELIYQFNAGSAFGSLVQDMAGQKAKLKAVTYPNQIFNISDDLESRNFTGPALGAIVLPEGSYTEQQLADALAPDVLFDAIAHRFTFPTAGIYNLQTGLAVILGVGGIISGPLEGYPGSSNINLGISRLKLSSDGLSTPVYVPHIGRYGDNLYHEMAEESIVTVLNGTTQLSVSYWVPALAKDKQLNFRKRHSINLMFTPLNG